MLCVVPNLPENFSDGGAATLQSMRMSEEGRVRISNVVVVPTHVAGGLPRWFQTELLARQRLAIRRARKDTIANSIDRDELGWAENISQYLKVGATVHVRQSALSRTRLWTLT